jgi:ribosomal protein S18 acetylase RimI-like enzyme
MNAPSNSDPPARPAPLPFIREAAPDDSPAIALLLGELGYPSPDAFVRERLAALASNSSGKVFVAECAGEIAGFLSFHIIPLFHSAAGLGRITTMAVSARFRRRSIGRLLVSAAEELAAASGCERMEVTSGDHRADAHAFYESLGFRCDVRRFIKQLPPA